MAASVATRTPDSTAVEDALRKLSELEDSSTKTDGPSWAVVGGGNVNVMGRDWRGGG
jgi:hypothetical protein